MTAQIVDSKTAIARFRSEREKFAMSKTNHESRCSASVRASAQLQIQLYMLQLIFSFVWLCFRPRLFNELTTTVIAFCFWLSYFTVPLASGPPFVNFSFAIVCPLKKSEKKGYLLGRNVSFENTFPYLWIFKVKYILPGCFHVACTIFYDKIRKLSLASLDRELTRIEC